MGNNNNKEEWIEFVIRLDSKLEKNQDFIVRSEDIVKKNIKSIKNNPGEYFYTPCSVEDIMKGSGKIQISTKECIDFFVKYNNDEDLSEKIKNFIDNRS